MMAGNGVANEDIYYPVEAFLYSIKKYDFLLDFSKTFFTNLTKKMASRVQFERLMKSYLFGEQLMFILEVFTYLAMHSAEFRKCDLVNYIISDQFYDNLVRHVYFLHEQKTKVAQGELKDFSILVKFYESIICYLPMSNVTYQKMYVLFEITFNCILIYGECGLKISEGIKMLLDLVQDMANSFENNVFFYKDLEVFPNEINLYEKRTLLPNIVEGRYDDSEKYLDVQFKLLRENFLQEMRDDLELFKKQRVGIPVKKKYDLYKNVMSRCLCSKSCYKYKICHVISFSPEDKIKLKKCDWKTSKKFMNGSLLIFTQNNFTTFISGIVETNYCALSEGRRLELQVSLFGNPYNLNIGSEYDMLEPSSFFAPYHRSLMTLKAINPYHFPFAEDIITVTKAISPSAINPSEIPLLLKQCNDLNKSQRDALTACLSQKFTLIQGPPGTGKSYLSRKLIKLLADNTDDKRPILVICMRNRSLDIILEPLARNGLKVLRFGRTEDEFLENFTFFKYKMKGWKSFKSKETFKFIKNNITSFRKFISDEENFNDPEAVEEVYQLHNEASEAIRLQMDYSDAFTILSKGIQVIGSTTTGAAKYYRLLSHLKPKAVIIEEAAEILESFVTSSLPSSCDHLVLVGDHMQLQPISRLPKELNMEISLFERMILNGKGYNRLTVQHRMRPEISTLISPLFYDDLTNHHSVDNYPDIDGVSKNVFFLTHTSSEQFKGDSMSFINTYEGDLVLSFANYLVKQGYSPADISILAAYSAQQEYLIKKSGRFPYLTGMPIETIDNYQGNENNIILLSLVRSNGETIGFLYKANRVNVALSRAKHGLYLFGNMETLTKFPNVWRKVDNLLKKRKWIGRSIELICKTHKIVTKVSTPEDIHKLEYGGCTKICNLKRECGHYCSLLCHPNLSLHNSTLCKKPCLRKPCGLHSCNKKCFEDCGPCKKSRQFELKCGHSASLQCSADPDVHLCNQKCKRLSSCGLHECRQRCYEKCGPCKMMRNFILKCGHQVSLPCSSNIDSYKCTFKCKRKSCSQHNCDKLCYENCGPCEKKLKFTLKCGHSATIGCMDDRKSFKCSEECNKYLNCGIHKCKKKCFEKCEQNCSALVGTLHPCGHPGLKICSQNIEETLCFFGCKIVMRPCGIHECSNSGCFDLCQEACNEPTPVTLQCGHTLLKKCSADPKLIKCPICSRHMLPCGIHECTKYCDEPCKEICNSIRLLKLECGHKHYMRCQEVTFGMYLESIKCKEVCNRVNKCNLHHCKRKCHYPSSCPPCDETVMEYCEYCTLTSPTKCGKPSSGICTFPRDVKYKNCPHTYEENCYKLRHPTYELLRKNKCAECEKTRCSIS